MSKGTILLADNIKLFADTRAEFLEKDGFTVLRAYSPGQAETILQTRWLHLAILDIRLSDESEEDTSGLDLAREERYRHIPKMILTGFPTVETTRDALSPDAGGTARVLRYVSKHELAPEMVRVVREIFRDFIRINHNLVIHWKNPAQVSLPHLAMLLDNQLDPADLSARIEELEDLLRMLFFEYSQLTISRLLWRKGTELVMDATAFSGETSAPMLIQVKLNPPAQTPEEVSAPEIKQPPLGIPQPIHRAGTLHFSACAWKLDLPLEEARPLDEFIRQNPERRTAAALENLFTLALKPWYQAGLVVSQEPLDLIYARLLDFKPGLLDPAGFEKRVREFLNACISVRLISSYSLENEKINLSIQNGQKIRLTQPWRTFSSGFPGSEIQRMLHSPGGIEVDKVLVDRLGNILLTDLGAFKLVPCEYDFINLEADLYTQALETHDLLAMFNMQQEVLAGSESLANLSAANVDVECRKAVAAIQTIRRLALEGFESKPVDYEVGLLFIACQRFGAYSPDLRLTAQELTAYLQYLTICGLLAGKLGGMQPRAVPESARAIRIDEKNHEVRLGDALVSLTPTEYDLLLYLFQKDGNLCRRKEIMHAVFQFDDAAPDSEKSLLNTHIGRLRAKIEQDVGNPRYLITVRGQGYKLVRQP